jgi:hypothetical protein
MESRTKEVVMNRLIAVFAVGICLSPVVVAFQLADEPPMSPVQVAKLEKVIVRSLESKSPSQQVEAALMLHRVKLLAPTHEWDRCIIPLMRILNCENNESSARVLAALVLHELRSERGDFAIARNAQFTDDARVKRYCTILHRTRLIERTKF